VEVLLQPLQLIGRTLFWFKYIFESIYGLSVLDSAPGGTLKHDLIDVLCFGKILS